VRTQVAHADPWTTEALYVLPEDGMRHELLDGDYLAVTGYRLPVPAARGARPSELRLPFPVVLVPGELRGPVP
jgi:hypothetical protein